MNRTAAALTLMLCSTAQADPMRPLGPAASASAAVSALTLAASSVAAPVLPPLLAIREDADGTRQALLGQRWLRVGMSVAQGAAPAGTVTAISASRVDITIGKTRASLNLLPPLVASVLPGTPATATSTHDKALAQARPANPPRIARLTAP